MRLYEAGPPKTVLDALEARHLLDVALHETGLKLRPQAVQQAISWPKQPGYVPLISSGKTNSRRPMRRIRSSCRPTGRVTTTISCSIV